MGVMIGDSARLEFGHRRSALTSIALTWRNLATCLRVGVLPRRAATDIVGGVFLKRQAQSSDPTLFGRGS